MICEEYVFKEWEESKMKMFTKSLVKKSVLLGGLAACLALGGAFDAGNVPDVLAVKQAHAEDVYAGTNRGADVYVMTHTIRWSGDSRFNVRTKSVRRYEYDTQGWGFVHTGQGWMYSLTESEGKHGLTPTSSPYYPVESEPIMEAVLNVCLNS